MFLLVSIRYWTLNRRPDLNLLPPHDQSYNRQKPGVGSPTYKSGAGFLTRLYSAVWLCIHLSLGRAFNWTIFNLWTGVKYYNPLSSSSNIFRKRLTGVNVLIKNFFPDPNWSNVKNNAERTFLASDHSFNLNEILITYHEVNITVLPNTKVDVFK